MAAYWPEERELPPLVSLAAELRPEQTARYARHLSLPGFGAEAQRRLLNARVAVVGAGGLGSPILLYLASAGVGTIGIIDDDIVEVSNLQRQIIHTMASVGRLKVESARSAVQGINPSCDVEIHALRLDTAHALDVLKGYDLVVDGSDNFATRYLVGDAAEILGIPCVWGSILRDEGQVTTFWGVPNDGFPGVVYRDLFPTPPAAGSVFSCAEGGVLGVLCASIGAAMANEVITLITGVGTSLLGRLQVYDARRARWREMPCRPDPSRSAVTGFGGGASHSEFGSGSEAGVVSWTSTQLVTALRDATFDDVLIDVRESYEFQIFSLPQARNIPLSEFVSGQASKLMTLDQTYAFICQSGARSAYLVALLREQGISNVYSVDGGMDLVSRVIDPARDVGPQAVAG